MVTADSVNFPQSTYLLLVEDNMAQAKMMETMLEEGEIEFPVMHVQTLAEASSFLQKSRVVCTLLDLTLPDADRLNGLMELRRIAPEVPVVVVTADDDAARAIKAVQLGAQDYLMKSEMESGPLCRSVRYAIERGRSELLLAHRALHDPLTGLPNRTLFLDRLDDAMSQMHRHEDWHVAVLFLDLNGFKAINDRLGHLAGDAVLRAMAGRLLEAIRPGDTVSRFGGDEFTVLSLELTSVEHAILIAERFTKVVSQPIEVEGEEISLLPSIGIVLSDRPRRPDQLIEQADRAMYVAKARGRPNYEIAKPE